MQIVSQADNYSAASESDPETGLYYYRAKYYDQTPGHFLTEDPRRFAGGYNFHADAAN